MKYNNNNNNKKNRNKLWKEGIKLLLLANIKVLYLENARESTKNY